MLITLRLYIRSSQTGALNVWLTIKMQSIPLNVIVLAFTIVPICKKKQGKNNIHIKLYYSEPNKKGLTRILISWKWLVIFSTCINKFIHCVHFGTFIITLNVKNIFLVAKEARNRSLTKELIKPRFCNGGDLYRNMFTL